MAKFTRRHTSVVETYEKELTKGELDAKHQACLEAKSIVFWKSPARIFKARSERYFVKIAVYGLVLILASIAIGEFALVGVIISLIFVVYVLAKAEPEVIEHRINSMGIVTGGKPFLWDELDSFWFDKKGDDRLLMVQTDIRFPTRLIIILTTVSERTLLDLLEKHLHFHHAPVHTMFDKWAQYLQQRVNFD